MALVELLTDLSKFKYTNYENVGANNSPIGGRHGGYEGGGEPPHPEEHSKFDDGAGENLSQIKGRHGGTEGPTPAQPPHPDDHSIHHLSLIHICRCRRRLRRRSRWSP